VKWSAKHEVQGPSRQDLEKAGLLPVNEPCLRWFTEQAEKFHAALQCGFHLSLDHTSSQKECSTQSISSSSTLPYNDGSSLQLTNEHAAEAFVFCWPHYTGEKTLSSEISFPDNNSAIIGQSLRSGGTETISTPCSKYSELSLIPELADYCTLLSGYYFSHVCRIISGFDSPKNPLRTWISTLLSQNSVIHHCVLSISATHLAQQKKAAGTLALEHHTNALSCLVTEVARLEEQASSCPIDDDELLAKVSNSVTALLFGIIMLGVTSVCEALSSNVLLMIMAS